MLQGRPLAVLGMGFARSSPFFDALEPRTVCASPPIWAGYEEEQRLRAVLGHRHPRRFGINSLDAATTCYVGGGAPRPHTLAQLRRPAGPCEAVVETWGSYEVFQIATGSEGVYSLGRPNVRGWRLRTYGPYEAADGVGELLIQTGMANRHVEVSIDQRYTRDDEDGARAEGGEGGEGGQGGGGINPGSMFGTRDIVEVLGSGLVRVRVRARVRVRGPNPNLP